MNRISPAGPFVCLVEAGSVKSHLPQNAQQRSDRYQSRLIGSIVIGVTITAGRETSVFPHGPQKHCLDPIACRSEWPQGASPEAEADAAVPCPTPQQSAQQKIGRASCRER